MSSPRLALYTTIYPGVERWLGAWWTSVQRQTDRAFDLWIGVDALTVADVCAALGEEPAAEWVLAEPGDTPAGLRQRAIGALVERYDGVVFADSDDVLDASRIAAARAALASHDVSACALRIMDEHGGDVGVVFEPGPGEDAAALLPRYNVFGLSNSAFRCEVLRRCLPVQRECVLFDWMIAARAWALGARMCFDRTPRMRYRQHPANTARVLPPFSAAQVMRAAEHVRVFYRCVLDDTVPLPTPYRDAFAAAGARVETFMRTLSASPARLAQYVDRLNRLTPQYVWWWCVAHPDLEDVWSH